MLKDRIAAEKGEVTADVTAASPLSAAQSERLAAALSKTVGNTVILNTAVDESLIGGLIVKVGSKMIDTSVASKLASLQHAMKEVG
ncbi:MAG: ATP synthase F1 subunit delta [Hyphomonas sp.]|nr:ATP synthase F1 subunit delta [Hyphomonas sp.]